jgi:predicted DNA-binding transcriptional regulator YafY
MKDAITRLSHDLLVIQGDGNYQQAKDLLNTFGVITPQLQEDLERINASGIPVDIVFEQGPEVLDLH